jgi:large subunit ribosomal protein L24
MRKIKKDDKVIVITGRDKGRIGVVTKIVDSGKRALVEGINMVKKHVKPNPNKNELGGIKTMEKSIDISNIAHYNPATQKADKVGIKVLPDGRKVRYYKSNQEIIDI